jgi:YidC/Oxa1 family membrane protein insertase
MRKNMPPEALTGPFAQQQKMMLYLFPIIFAVGGINFPIGVLIYWLASNLWTMGQQFYVIRRNPAPGTPAYEAWEERRKEKLARKAAHRAPTVEAATADGGVVARGGGSNGNGSSPIADSGSTQDPPRVVRQQPRKQTRSQRKQ